MGKEQIKVVIADDHNLFREGVKVLLSQEPDIVIVGECNDGQELLNWLADHTPDVILLDINMPGIDGLSAAKQVKTTTPDIQILALSMSLEDRHIADMLSAGANGYLLKTAGREELVSAIKAVHARDSYFSREVSDKLLRFMRSDRNHDGANYHNDLPITPREQEILVLIAAEKTNQEIAQQLHISVRTVDTHRRNLLQKLHVRNTAGLVKYAIENKLV
jgi:DNA-binding NarL/FixJ family response regulator